MLAEFQTARTVFMCAALSAWGFGAFGSDEDHAQSAYNVTLENDVFFGFDQYYTNGIQFERRYLWSETTDRELNNDRLTQACAYFGCQGFFLHTRAHKVGQLMYTPADITVSSPQPDDRPWAGLLYYAQDNVLMAPSRDALTKFTFQIGGMGAASLAEQTQKAIHKVINSKTPMGWSNQAKSELGLLLGVERKFALDSLSGGATDGWQWRSSGGWRITGGNIMTMAAAKLEFTVGKGLPKLEETAGDIDTKMRPPVLMSAPVPLGIATDLAPTSSNELKPAAAVDRTCLFPWLECKASAAVEARLMAYNAFLDGPLFRDGPKVDSRPVVVDASVSLQLRFPRTASKDTGPVFVQFKATRRTPEFRSSQPVKSQSFGALTVGCDFF